MKEEGRFHIAFVAWPETLVERLTAAIESRYGFRCSHILHPRHTAADFRGNRSYPDVRFFRDALSDTLPEPDPDLLASLEGDGVPTIHNMILGDRVVANLAYHDALRYTTFLASRLSELYDELEPSVVVSGFDALHGAVSLAVAKRMGVPWFAPNFSTIPPGLTSFCDQMSPGARVLLTDRDSAELRRFAEVNLRGFLDRSVDVPAYVTPPALSFGKSMRKLPARCSAIVRTIRRARVREHLQFTDDRTSYSIGASIRQLARVRSARNALARLDALSAPPTTPYVFFGLHMQPESTIDVWAPFFSNQTWVIELLSRSIPPSHRLLVKIHKSDAANYSKDQLARLQWFPGVDLVHPFCDSRSFIEHADLIITIQGTMGLEAALLGKPLIVLGDSPVAHFPSVSTIGEIPDLPGLVRSKLSEAPPTHDEIIDAYTEYFTVFFPACYNEWSVPQTNEEISAFADLFGKLGEHVSLGGPGLSRQKQQGTL